MAKKKLKKKKDPLSDLIKAGMINGYKVDIMSRCEHSEREDKEYGSWSESHSNRLGKVTVDAKYPSLMSRHIFKPGDTAFLVWLEYSSGDSFGSNKRGSTLSIGLFKDVAPAQELVKHIKSVKDNDLSTASGDKFGMLCKTKDKQLFKMEWCPWHGYFETLEEVHIDVVTLGVDVE